MRRLVLGILALFLSGCAARETAPPPVPPAVSEVLARIRNRPRPRSLRTLANFQLRFSAEEPGGLLARELGLGGTYAGKAILLWRAPASLRLEPLTPLGTPVAVVVAREKSLRAYLPGRARFFEGRADASSMARLFGVPIGTGLLVRLLQGALPVAEGAEAEQGRIGWDEEASAFRLELPPGGGLDRRQVVWLERDSWRPRRALLGEAGAEMEVHFGPFREWGGGHLPEWVEMTAPKGASRLRVEVTLPPSASPAEFPEGVFDLAAPPGVRVLPLDESAFR